MKKLIYPPTQPNDLSNVSMVRCKMTVGIQASAAFMLGQRIAYSFPTHERPTNHVPRVTYHEPRSTSHVPFLSIGIIAVTMGQFVHLTKLKILSKKARPPLDEAALA